MKPGDPVRVDGKLAHVEFLLVAVRFEDGERRTVMTEHVVPWPPPREDDGGVGRGA